MKRSIIRILCLLVVICLIPSSSATAAGSGNYRVAFVRSDDYLSVRSGPGVENSEVGQLPYNAANVVLTGASRLAADGGTWVPVQWTTVSGWVNRYFLTEQVEHDEFCTDLHAYALVYDLMDAIRARSNSAISMITGSFRGLLLRRHTWNTEVRLYPSEVTAFFTDATIHNWGVGDGSGEPINGSTAQILLPLFDQNLVHASKIACNQLLGGGTAGMVVLPTEYQQVNYFSVYRPALAGDELNWGSWAIGVEYWDGTPFIAFLVHYQWEI